MGGDFIKLNAQKQVFFIKLNARKMALKGLFWGKLEVVLRNSLINSVLTISEFVRLA
jgi:hypothetical protein